MQIANQAALELGDILQQVLQQEKNTILQAITPEKILLSITEDITTALNATTTEHMESIKTQRKTVITQLQKTAKRTKEKNALTNTDHAKQPPKEKHVGTQTAHKAQHTRTHEPNENHVTGWIGSNRLSLVSYLFCTNAAG